MFKAYRAVGFLAKILEENNQVQIPPARPVFNSAIWRQGFTSDQSRPHVKPSNDIRNGGSGFGSYYREMRRVSSSALIRD